MNEQVELFNKTLLNILFYILYYIFYFIHNFIPSKFILFDGKDPPWMNDEIKILIKKKNGLSQCQRKSGNLSYASLNFITQDISNKVNSSKLKCRERLSPKLK